MISNFFSSISFGVPAWLWALLVLPLMAVLFARAEVTSAKQLQQFVAARLLPRLAGTIDRKRRLGRFSLFLLALALAVVSLAQPRAGYTYDEVKRKGLDLIFAIDTSRSMLSNDVPPNRLQRVKLAAQDLLNQLQGDRVGLIAFAGRAFLQAPLTIDYDAAVEAITDLDTHTIPEGGTNISEAIALAVQTYGKSAIGNRALIIFTDGEELNGDATRAAKAAADAGVRIFTVGVGTPEGSLIPISADGGGQAFVKDARGQIVKSKLDEKRLRDIAEATGGAYFALTSGQSAMQNLYRGGLSKMQTGEIDDRMSRRPIERYQWPLAGAVLALAAALLLNERKRKTLGTPPPARARRAVAVAALMLCLALSGTMRAASPGLDEYRRDKFGDAYEQFRRALDERSTTAAEDKLQFDAGAAAYRLKDYGKAMEAFSQSLLSKDAALQSKSHYNLGNTLYERGEAQKKTEPKLADWNNALQHYEQTLKIEPQNRDAKENYEFVKNKIEELKKAQEQPTPTPSPSPSPKKNEQSKPEKQDKNDQQKSEQEKQKKDQQQSGQSDQEKKDQQGQDKNKDEGADQNKADDQQQKEGEQPSPSPTAAKSPAGSPSPAPNAGTSPSPSDSPGESPAPREEENAGSPSPSPSASEHGEGDKDDASPSATPAGSPGKPLSGEVKGAPGEAPEKPQDEARAAAEAEALREGRMSPEQAEHLLRSLKDEEQRVQLDERRVRRHVYNDW